MQFQQHFCKSSFLSMTEESERVHSPTGVDEGRRFDQCSLSSVPKRLFWTLHDIKPVTSEAPSKLAWCVQTFYAAKRRAPTCSELIAVWWNLISAVRSEESVAVIEVRTSHTASDGFDNFIRQWATPRYAAMPGCGGICKYCSRVCRMTASGRELLQGCECSMQVEWQHSTQRRKWRHRLCHVHGWLWTVLLQIWSGWVEDHSYVARNEHRLCSFSRSTLFDTSTLDAAT